MILYTNYPDLQTAINATPSGDILQLPAFPISILGPVTINKNISIQGTCKDTSLIVVPNGRDGLIITGSTIVKFSDFGLVGTYQTGAGNLIKYESSNGNSIFRNLSFDFGYNGISIQSGSTNLIDGCWFQQQSGCGAVISGGEDNQITSCSFATGQPNAIGIYYTGVGGGLRISNSKILGGQISVFVFFNSGMADGDLLITGCSFENSPYGIIIEGQTGAKFSNILITGNEIASTSYSFISFPINGTINWLKNVLLTGNLLHGQVAVMGIISGYSNVGNINA